MKFLQLTFAAATLTDLCSAGEQGVSTDLKRHIVGSPRPSRRRASATLPADLSPMLDEFVRENGLVGIAAFAASSDAICAVGCAGNLSATVPGIFPSHSPPVDLWSSPWHGGSLTKSMTASLAALLIKDEKIALEWETTLGEVFPEAKYTPYENVTLEQLSNHRGGFRKDVIEKPEDMDQLSGGTLVQQRRGVALFGFTTDPAVAPGKGFIYSDFGYTILGSMMEQRTGAAWENLITERLFRPLGMDSAYFGCPDTLHAPTGHFFDKNTGGLLPMHPGPGGWCGCAVNYTETCFCDIPPAGGPAGNVYMQLGDYIRYYQWHLAGDREDGGDSASRRDLLSAEEFRRLHKPSGSANESEMFPLSGYGNGWAMREVTDLFGEHDVLWHTGSSQFMWSAEVYVAPQSDRVLFVASNSMFSKTGLQVSFDSVFADMMSSVNKTCDGTMIDDLDKSRDPGMHDECPTEILGSFDAEGNTQSDAW
eukprot:CAMPEP_0197450184 /NCGR_PEP_ID=MMETSP1175-20131217/24319_1 /TAXON_ID=1003142 /ORGANISM="Triceratium dubium, Strain CCMP147" /LENGTH=478 /DNA_ID=CAMNT_0042982549 /DNA_START=67 /DNA_END=1500 /DNA_ORIENTATION=+